MGRELIMIILKHLEILQRAAESLSILYEAYPDLNNAVEISKVIPYSLDEWSADFDQVIHNIQVEYGIN